VSVIHKLTGYDKVSEKLAAQIDVPISQLGQAKQVAGVGQEDPEAALSYPLTSEQAKRIGQTIGQFVDTDRYLWFLEPFADWGDIKREREKLGLRT
jgi:hypothetical protein